MRGPSAVSSALWLSLTLALSGACDLGAGKEAPSAAPQSVTDRRPVPQSSQRPNLLLLSIDTLRADRLGAYGYTAARTPTIDALGASGVRFSDASTPVPRTTQAIASLFTSRAPEAHGVREVGERLPDTELTLAEVLGSSGYRTLAVTGNSVADRAQGLDQGFDRFISAATLREMYREADMGGPWERGAARVTRAALELLREGEEAPYFLWAHYKDPHYVYNPPPEFLSSREAEAFAFYKQSADWKPARATVFYNLNGEAEKWRKKLSGLYDAELRYVDAMVGRLLAGVRERDAKRGTSTLVVFTSDHGESLGEHGYYFEHGDFVYQVTLRVPLIFSLPDTIPGGRVIDLAVSLVDLVPSTLSLLGVAPPEGHRFEGRDLGALVTGEVAEASFAPQPLFAESGSAMLPWNPIRELGGRRSGDKAFRYVRRDPWLLVHAKDRSRLFRVDSHASGDAELRGDQAAQHPEVVAQLEARLDELPLLADRWRSIRNGRWKLIRIPSSRGLRYELYDLTEDPLEVTDLSARQPAVVARLASALDAHLSALPPDRPPESRSLSEQERVDQRLRALGYVE